MAEINHTLGIVELTHRPACQRQNERIGPYVKPELDDHWGKYDNIQFEQEDGVLEIRLHSDDEDFV